MEIENGQNETEGGYVLLSLPSMHSWTAVDMLSQEYTETHTRTLVYLKHMHVFAQIHKICERLEVVFSRCCSG